MIYAFKLPDIGEGLAEGEVSSWLVNEGDQINEDDGLVEIQNDKSVEEIPSPVTGVIKKIEVQVGEVASVGDILVQIETDHIPHGEEHVENEKVDTETASTLNVQKKVEDNHENKSSFDINILAMPSVRKYAREHDVNLVNVTPTGRKGHILKSDIDNYLNNPQNAVMKQSANNQEIVENSSVLSSDTEVTTLSMDRTRIAIANAMVNSKHTAPHVTLFDDVEVSLLIKHRKKYKDVLAEENVKLTYLSYIVKALTLTLKKYPTLNSSVDMENKVIKQHSNINIGIATDTEHGLYVPVIKNADHLGLKSIAKNIQDNTIKAKEHTLSGNDMSGGTMTITNIGSIGGGYFTPIINVPEVAILGIGTIKKEPIVNENDEIVIGNILKLSLSFDHRIIDGALAQSAMNYLKRLLNDPELLLMEG